MAKIPYANAIGSLTYVMVCTRPDIAYSVSLVSRFMSNPGKVHWKALKWILRYIKGSLRKGLAYEKTSLQKVVALSSIEAEYITLIEAVKEVLWLRGIARELKLQVLLQKGHLTMVNKCIPRQLITVLIFNFVEN